MEDDTPSPHFTSPINPTPLCIDVNEDNNNCNNNNSNHDDTNNNNCHNEINVNQWKDVRIMYQSKRIDQILKYYLQLQENGEGVFASVDKVAEKYAVDKEEIWKELISRRMVIFLNESVG